MSSRNDAGNGHLKPAFSRQTAKQIAASNMYTASGEPIRNLDAYMGAGSRAYNSAGQVIQNPTAYQNAIEASVRQNTTDPKYLYHYTTSDAAASIEASGCIQGSQGGWAGSGTYLTAKPPRSSTSNLLANNYGSATARDASYVSDYVRLNTDTLSASYVGDGRDVWKANGDVHLEEHGGYVAQRQSDNSESHGSPFDGTGFCAMLQAPTVEQDVRSSVTSHPDSVGYFVEDRHYGDDGDDYYEDCDDGYGYDY